MDLYPYGSNYNDERESLNYKLIENGYLEKTEENAADVKDNEQWSGKSESDDSGRETGENGAISDRYIICLAIYSEREKLLHQPFI